MKSSSPLISLCALRREQKAITVTPWERWHFRIRLGAWCCALWTRPNLFLVKANLIRGGNRFTNVTTWTSPYYCIQCSLDRSKDFCFWRVLAHFLPVLPKFQPLCIWEVSRVRVIPGNKYQRLTFLVQPKWVTIWWESMRQVPKLPVIENPTDTHRMYAMTPMDQQSTALL